MKFTIPTVLKTAFSVAALLATTQVSALPTGPHVAIEKRGTPGLNDYSCKLTPAHPRPLVLVHGTTLTLDSWNDFIPVFINQGYCVFGLTYGKFGVLTSFGGLAPIEQNAQEVGTFVNSVLAKMNVSQVDIVGHSQGGILARYWIKYLDGAGKVNRHVGLSAIHHGTTLSGITTIAKALGLFEPSQPLFDAVAPSLFEMVNTSPFIAKLNAGGDTSPGVIESNIATKYDEIVTPFTSCYQEHDGIVNVELQTLCPLSLNEHLLIQKSKVALRFVLNQLDPATAQTANCLSAIF